MERNNCDALRKLAIQAKKRLGRRNYFEGNGGYKMYEGGLVADYKLVHLNGKEDEKFYERVREILEENFDTVNPLGRLVDRAKIDAMSNKERERYIINLADRYIKMKARFEREHLSSAEFVG